MGFLGVYRALYDYVPQAQGELAIQEGDVLYVLEKDGGDGWWKAKKKAGTEDEDEPEGLIPHNYVQEAPAICHARALYEYTRQTDEELSFPEDALLEVFDTGDPDWILVGMDDEFGFVPANYIEMSDPADAHEDDAAHPAPSLPARPASIPSEPTGASESVGAAAPPAAAALASVLAGRAPASPVSPSSPPAMPSRNMSTPEQRASEDESLRSPALPSRPRPATEPSRSRYEEPVDAEPNTDTRRVPGGFHMYNINEMVSVMGKRKKMPTTLGINLGTGVILIAPERASDGPSQEWSAEKMTHYSREGKHVFMELVKPSKSVDFHAGAKDTAEEIVGALGEMAGAVRAEGLKEVIMAGSSGGRKRGQVLYDFMAQGDDEVTVAVGDEVIIVDDSKSEEWWQVRRIKNGKEGVVPSSYVEITGVTSPAPTSGHSHGDSIKSTVEQNRLEEVRLTKEALRASKEPQEVGPGMPLPERGSSLAAREHGNDSSQQRSRRENGRTEGSGKSKSKPDSSKVRTWTDRSKSFSVEAQFLGLKDGKIHLHKMNGVKIAVPIAKMSREDLEYVENATGLSLDDDKPLADVKRSKPSEKASKTPSSDAARGAAGASANKKPEYDWFQFFLDCDVAVGLCERYAQAFLKDSMDESVLPDVDANVLRQLGLREGDIIKVMRYLDNRFGRKKSSGGDGDTEGGGLFSGPGGALRNNTRKGRPAPAVQTSDVVDPKAFSGKDTSDTKDEIQSPLPASSPPNGTSARPATSGFDDDAWDVKPSKQQPPPRAATVSPAASGPTAPPQQPALTGSMQELSLLTAPLQPSRTEPVTSSEPTTQAAVQPQPNAPQQPQGATPSFFSSVSPQATARQRPLPPQTSPVHGGLVPPPGRPLSAPQSAQPYAPPPGMAPQMTGAMQGRPAAPGQSLNEITQARLQQQYLANMQQQQQVQPPPQQPMMTGYMGQQMQPMNSMYTGAPQQYMQPMMTGSVGPSPFADPGRPTQFSPIQSQPTGFQQSFTGGQPGFPQQTAPGGINNYLPPALEPQRTGIPGIQPQPTGMNSFGQQAPPQPLQPQKTGPAPPVRFGVAPDAKKLTPQATGRRANLSQATPQNPFGF